MSTDAPHETSMRYQQQVIASLNKLPSDLRPQVETWWQDFVASNSIDYFNEKISSSLPVVWAGSEFVARNCLRYPTLLHQLVTAEDVFESHTAETFRSQLQNRLADVNDEAQLLKQLREFRRYHMTRIIWRDLAGWSELVEVTQELSILADTCIQLALDILYNWQCKKYGTPMHEDPLRTSPQQMLVIGMGKLGAWELNLSSDVDLIFVYAHEGKTQPYPDTPGTGGTSHGEFFNRLGKSLIHALQHQTEDGFVFRVDMRLRPFGEGGTLTSSFNALENYYQIHGREWERYAMIKARVITGEEEDKQNLMAMLRPFIYRRYLDYGAYESMREMKAMIVQEVKRKGLQNNVKLGAGGIREVEFIGQVFQLIRGGRDRDFQERRILIILTFLKAKDLLPDYVIDQLIEAYIFLRNAEHRIQAYQDKQSHVLPDDATGRQRLAFSMGFADWKSFLDVLNTHRENVRSHFEQVFDAPQSVQPVSGAPDDLNSLWQDQIEKDKALQLLTSTGYTDAENALNQIEYFRRSHDYKTRSALGQQRMDQLMPLLIGAVGRVNHPEETLKRVLDLVSQIAKRSVYISLLVENPLALSQLAQLYSFSPWVARYLTQTPILLDELLDARSLYVPPDKMELQSLCRSRLSQVSVDDEEQRAEVVRHFKHTNVLRVAAADLAEAIPLMTVSNHLTWIAETVLEETLEQAWHHMVKKHGRPTCTNEGPDGMQACDKGFAIIGYGKLGGYELGYGSDLDLVFLHGAESEHAATSGEKAVANSTFFARLGQRLIHLLTALTPAGILYEVDMRLRPDGASGMLVSSLKAFDAYQREKAWLWEHQALVRARAIGGDPIIIEAFNQIRHAVLIQPRDDARLRQDVASMREKMRTSLSKDSATQFDLKQGSGGIVDIEFIVQYGVLAWSHAYPDLTTYTDNVRILESFAQTGNMPQADITALTEAYLTFRGRLHRLALQEQPGLLAAEEYVETRALVSKIWQKWFAEAG